MSNEPGLRYRVFTRSSKRPALARVFWIHSLEVCWTFAGSCKHLIILRLYFLSVVEAAFHSLRFSSTVISEWV